MDVVALIALAFALGGILKGATGAGAPILAVPVMAMFYDVPFAVTVFAIPNIVPNLWQGWAFRREMPETRFVVLLALSGAAGAIVGTFLLANLPSGAVEKGGSAVHADAVRRCSAWPPHI